MAPCLLKQADVHHRWHRQKRAKDDGQGIPRVVADDKAADSRSGEPDRAHEEDPGVHANQPQAPELSAEHLGGKLMRRAGQCRVVQLAGLEHRLPDAPAIQRGKLILLEQPFIDPVVDPVLTGLEPGHWRGRAPTGIPPGGHRQADAKDHDERHRPRHTGAPSPRTALHTILSQAVPGRDTALARLLAASPAWKVEHLSPLADRDVADPDAPAARPQPGPPSQLATSCRTARRRPRWECCLSRESRAGRPGMGLVSPPSLSTSRGISMFMARTLAPPVPPRFAQALPAEGF